MKTIALILFVTCSSFAQSAAQPAAPSPAQAPPLGLQADDARIQPADVLDIVVYREPELTRSVRVDSAGMVTIPVAGDIKAAGLTTDALAAKIKTVLSQSLTDPDVTVSIRELGLESVYVMGAVRVPGAYTTRGSTSLLNILAKAGSVTENADETIQVIRKSSGGNAPIVTVSTQDLIRNGKTDLNLTIYPGDTVNVIPKPAASYIMVVGQVVKGGEIPMRSPKGTTVRQALAEAGWFTPDAKKKDAKIIRFHADNGTHEELKINLDRVTDASFEDMVMLPNDILYVPASKGKIAAGRALDSAIGITSSRLTLLNHP